MAVPCARCRRAQARRDRSSRLCRSFARNPGRTGERDRHGAGDHSRAVRAACGRCVVVAVLPVPRHRASDRHRQRNRMPHNARAGITMGALAFAAASMAASRWRCATAARWSCRRICFAMPGPSGRPTSTAGRGFGKSFFDQFVRGTNWSLDKPSPFETARVRDPAPDMSLVSAALIKSNPELKDIEVAEAWGGTIDRTPDTIPVISPIDTMLGFFLATGFAVTDLTLGPRPASSPPTS
jgi:hypothetical protein